jgi:hypothetical protein
VEYTNAQRGVACYSYIQARTQHAPARHTRELQQRVCPKRHAAALGKEFRKRNRRSACASFMRALYAPPKSPPHRRLFHAPPATTREECQASVPPRPHASAKRGAPPAGRLTKNTQPYSMMHAARRHARFCPAAHARSEGAMSATQAEGRHLPRCPARRSASSLTQPTENGRWNRGLCRRE